MPVDTVLAIVASVLLGGAAVWQKRGVVAASRARDLLTQRQWLSGVAAELVSDGVYVVAVMWPGARLVHVQPIVALHFVVAMALGAWLLGERATRGELLAAALLVAGGALVLLSRGPAREPTTPSLTALYIALGVFALGALVVFRHRRSAIALASLAGLAFTISVVGMRICSDSLWTELGWPPSWDALLWVVTSFAPLVTIAGNIGGFVLTQLAFKRGRVFVVSPVIGLVSLVMPVLLGLLAMGENATMLAGMGIVLVFAGIALLVAAGLRRAGEHDPAEASA